MIPEHVTETVTSTKLPNFEEKFDISTVEFVAMKRFHDQVNFEPVLRPVKFKDTIVCYKNSTKKRFVSRTYYEPKIKPKVFLETLVIFPKRPERTFVALLDYHIDECRKWFKTTMEFKARTYTTSKIMKDSAYESDLDLSSNDDSYTGTGSDGTRRVTNLSASF
ncbi:hypothetical protein FSP39_011910 [Pinctada imbricata]|uniref:Uncharacterized protein n=1 Tax=Pinctada imbricata TaxID=66713 RepID=A0AA89BKU0_PINIB|nr:hypothetical protein FSP39_011910 [Pinctada imbricata]